MAFPAFSSVPLLEPGLSTGSKSGRWAVVIFNNDTNSMDEVVGILMKATGCDVQEASIETWEAHTFGRAMVHFGSQADCQKAAQIISAIGVKTEVIPEWNDSE